MNEFILKRVFIIGLLHDKKYIMYDLFVLIKFPVCMKEKLENREKK